MNTIIHIAMLLLSYLALYSAYRAGLEKLKYKYELLNEQNVSYAKSTNTWISMMSWLGLCVLSIALLVKIATP